MKTNFLKVTLMLLVIGLINTSCKKDDDSPNNNNSDGSSNGTTTYVVTLKKDSTAEIKYVEGSAIVLGDKLIIGANNDDSDIQFSLEPGIATGTYTDGYLISHGVNGVAVFSTATNVQSSSLTITTHNTNTKHLVGSFSVDYTDNNDQSAHHATGSFDVTYK